MKKLVRLTALMLLALLIGFTGAVLIITYVKDIPLSVLWEKLNSINLLKIAGISFLPGGLIFIAIFLQIILHEGGHLICGLVTGYRFVSFRIFNLTLIKQNNKFHIKRFGIAGTGGQCLLAPPDKPLSEISTAWYNLGGVIANLLTSILSLIALFTIANIPYPIELFLILFCLIGFFLAATNGIPLKIGGIGNDAHNMRLLLKNKKSKQALITQLRINALIQEGMRPKEMPQEWFYIKDTNYKDTLQTTIKLMQISRLQDSGDHEVTYLELEKLLSHKKEIIELLIKEITCELIFAALVTGRNDRAIQLYTPYIQTYTQQYKKITTSKQRLLCAWAFHQETDLIKAREIYETVYRQKEQYLMQGEVNMDLALMESILTV